MIQTYTLVIIQSRFSYPVARSLCPSKRGTVKRPQVRSHICALVDNLLFATCQLQICTLLLKPGLGKLIFLYRCDRLSSSTNSVATTWCSIGFKQKGRTLLSTTRSKIISQCKITSLPSAYKLILNSNISFTVE